MNKKLITKSMAVLSSAMLLTGQGVNVIAQSDGLNEPVIEIQTQPAPETTEAINIVPEVEVPDSIPAPEQPTTTQSVPEQTEPAPETVSEETEPIIEEGPENSEVVEENVDLIIEEKENKLMADVETYFISRTKFKTIYRANPGLAYGDQVVVQEGVVGEIRTDYVNGQEVGETILSEPVDKIIEVGNIQVVEEIGEKSKRIITTTYEVVPETGELINPSVETTVETSIEETGAVFNKIIYYNTIYRGNSSLAHGEQVVVQQGKNGISTTKTVDGVETEIIVKEPVDKIIEVGTTSEETREVYPEWIYQKSDEIEAGRSVVAQEGVIGEYTYITTYEVDPGTGALVNPTVNTVVITEKKDQIVISGTKLARRENIYTGENSSKMDLIKMAELSAIQSKLEQYEYGGEINPYFEKFIGMELDKDEIISIGHLAFLSILNEDPNHYDKPFYKDFSISDYTKEVASSLPKDYFYLTYGEIVEMRDNGEFDYALYADQLESRGFSEEDIQNLVVTEENKDQKFISLAGQFGLKGADTPFNFVTPKEPEIVEVIKEVPVEVEVEVIKEVIKEVPVEKLVEVIKEVPVEKIVEVIKEVPVDRIVEVIKEVPVEKIVEVEVEKIVEVIKEVPVDRVVEVEKIVEIIKEVPVEKLVEVIKEIPVEVIKEVPVDRIVEVIKEVPVEKIVEVIKEVPVDRIVEVEKEVIIEVVKEVPVEKIVEITKEVPVEKLIEVIKEVPVEVIREVEVEKIVEIIKEVPVEKVIEIEKVVEVVKEVPVDRVIEVVKEIPVEKVIEVIKEVPVEKIVEVIKEVPVEKIIEIEKEVIVKEIQIVEVIKEVPVEVIKEVPVEKIIEIIKEIEVPVIKEVPVIVEVPVEETTTETETTVEETTVEETTVETETTTEETVVETTTEESTTTESETETTTEEETETTVEESTETQVETTTEEVPVHQGEQSSQVSIKTTKTQVHQGDKLPETGEVSSMNVLIGSMVSALAGVFLLFKKKK